VSGRASSHTEADFGHDDLLFLVLVFEERIVFEPCLVLGEVVLLPSQAATSQGHVDVVLPEPCG
jgi:hypothetical protein